MISESFDYVRPTTVDSALSQLTEHGEDAKVIAGGHSLLPLMKMRLAAPSVLIDIERIEELSYIRDAGDELLIGGLVRHEELERSEVVRSGCGLLAHVASFVGDRQVRARGTLGGSLAHGDPAADLPAALLAVRGSVVLRSPRGVRIVPADAFFLGFLETALGPDEILVEVRVPKAPEAAFSYQKFVRRAQDWAVVGVAVHVDREPTVALVNMGTTPLRAAAVETALLNGASPSEAAVHAAAGTAPPEDLSASPDYRRHLARVLTRRALEETVSGAARTT